MDPIILKIDPFSGFNGIVDNVNYLNGNKDNNNSNYNCNNTNKDKNNNDDNSNNIDNSNINNKYKDNSYNKDYNLIIGDKEEIFTIAKRVLLQPGGLVSIPTETVYGLAGNIYLEESLKRIFKIKNRPLNDPLIVHVYSFEYAIKYLYDINEIENKIIKYLSEKFTPGPLTIVSRCKNTIPKILTNDSGYLAVRCPNNKLCLELLKYIKVPLAAPSANKFGHISPTCVEHVFDEFRGERLYILDGGQCKIGIESTVIKVYTNNRIIDNNYNKEQKKQRNEYNNTTKEREKEENGKTERDEVYENIICSVEILRKGAVTYEDLNKALKGFRNVKVYESVKRVDGGQCKIESPGMLTKHYAPNVPTYMILVDDDNNKDNNKINKYNNYKDNKDYNKKNKDNERGEYFNIDCNNIILIDIGCRFKRYYRLFKSYLPVENDPIIIANQLYSLLRRAENLSLSKNNKDNTNNNTNKDKNNNDNNSNNKDNINSDEDEENINNHYSDKDNLDRDNIIGIYFNEENSNLFSSIYDRLLRATSGNVVYAKEIDEGIKFVRE